MWFKHIALGSRIQEGRHAGCLGGAVQALAPEGQPVIRPNHTGQKADKRQRANVSEAIENLSTKTGPRRSGSLGLAPCFNLWLIFCNFHFFSSFRFFIVLWRVSWCFQIFAYRIFRLLLHLWRALGNICIGLWLRFLIFGGLGRLLWGRRLLIGGSRLFFDRRSLCASSKTEKAGFFVSRSGRL